MSPIIMFFLYLRPLFFSMNPKHTDEIGITVITKKTQKFSVNNPLALERVPNKILAKKGEKREATKKWQKTNSTYPC